MTSSTETLLGKLAKFSQDNLAPIYVPSAGKVMQFKNLNVRQQKDLIKTALDGAASGATLNQTLNEIVVSNSVDPFEFNILDRYAIAVQLRAYFVSDIYTTTAADSDLEISLNSITTKNIAAFKELSVELDTCISVSPEFTISLKVPTIQHDIKINDKFIKFTKSKESNALGDLIGDLYIYEIVKFIQTIQSGDDVYDFNTVKLTDCIKIVESLPGSINAQILEFIETTRKAENLFLQIDTESAVQIDAAFFTKS
jgi:hypothetical protein